MGSGFLSLGRDRAQVYLQERSFWVGKIPSLRHSLAKDLKGHDMWARLISLSGHPIICVTKTMTLVGRHQSCDVRISSSRVSRCHCCLLLENEELVVRDLKSTNGTRVNGHAVQSSQLKHGDSLSIAHLRYHVSLENSLNVGVDALPDILSLSQPGDEQSTALEIIPLRTKEQGNEPHGPST